jgi:hypothetical protein
MRKSCKFLLGNISLMSLHGLSLAELIVLNDILLKMMDLRNAVEQVNPTAQNTLELERQHA